MESRSDSDCPRTGGKLRISALEKSGTTFSESQPETSSASASTRAGSASRGEPECIRAAEFGERTCGVCNSVRLSSAWTGFKCEFGTSDKFSVERSGLTTLAQESSTGDRNARSDWHAERGQYCSTEFFFELAARDYAGYTDGVYAEPERYDSAGDPDCARRCDAASAVEYSK
jgi:hypothetical protein